MLVTVVGNAAAVPAINAPGPLGFMATPANESREQELCVSTEQVVPDARTIRGRTAAPTVIALRVAAAALVIALGPTPAVAQGYPFSQRGSVSQSIAFTEVVVTYGRPVARGRALFGALVPWDSIWHPGADSATVITFGHDVLIDGHSVAAGSYSLWLIPRSTGAWTLILHRDARVFHKPYPGVGGEALRLDLNPESGAHIESLLIYFPAVLRDEATLRIHWGTTMVSVRIKAPYRTLDGAPL